MNDRNGLRFYAMVTMLVLLGGCVTPPAPDKPEDTRLDQLVSNMDKSLANQATANAQLEKQQRQLELQQQHLESLSKELDEALEEPAASNCPAIVPCPKLPVSSSKLVVGGLEKVWLPDLEFALTARIDTGASTSSIDARNIEEFERDGKRWVRFEILDPVTKEPVSVERRLKRTVGIVQSGGAETQRRPVVRMGIIIGKFDQTAEFSLSNRSHSSYQVLVGRNILKDVMVVDVSTKNAAPYVIPDKSTGSKGAAK